MLAAYACAFLAVPIFSSRPKRLQNDFKQVTVNLHALFGFRQGALVSEVASAKATNAEMKQLIAALQEKSDKQVNMPAI